MVSYFSVSVDQQTDLVKVIQYFVDFDTKKGDGMLIDPSFSLFAIDLEEAPLDQNYQIHGKASNIFDFSSSTGRASMRTGQYGVQIHGKNAEYITGVVSDDTSATSFSADRFD